MDVLILSQSDGLCPKTVRVLPDDVPLAQTVRELLSSRFVPVAGGTATAALTVICSDEINIPPRGAVIIIGNRDEDCGRIVFLPRPLDFERFFAAVLKMTEPESEFPDGYKINAQTRTVAYRGRETILTGREFQLFSVLNATPGKLVTKEAVKQALWQNNSTNSCDVYVCYLREKLEPLAGRGAIISVRGKGYILSSPTGVYERKK